MLLSPRQRSTAADLLRVVACWLSMILLVQGLQGAINLGTGPRHVHDSVAAPAQAHQHDGFERHHHAVDDRSVRTDGSSDEALDSVAFALAAALALMVLASARRTASDRRHVLRAATVASWRSVLAPPRRRPPRAG
jgi:heme A synthase